MARTKSKRNRRGASFWMAHIKAQEKSGLKVSEYCRRHGLAASTFYDWKRRFSRSSSSQLNLVSLPERLVGDHGQGLQDFFCEIRICIGRGYRVEVGEGFNALVLKRVVSVLESI